MNWVFLAVGIAILYQAAVLVLITVGWRNPRAPGTGRPLPPWGSTSKRSAFPRPAVDFSMADGIACGASGAPVVILVHGWGRNVQRMLPYVKMLHPAGFDLLAFDARHHGSSDEDDYASMPKFAEDILAGVDWVERRCGTEVHIGVLGLSVGGSAAILASSRDERITAVATVGAFADPRDPRATLGRFWWILGPGLPLAFRFVEWRMGLRFKSFAPQNVIGRSRCPFLLIHGSEDTVVPAARHARRLAAAAGASARLWIIPGRNHSDPHLEPGMADTLAAFFRDTLDGAHVAAMGK